MKLVGAIAVLAIGCGKKEGAKPAAAAIDAAGVTPAAVDAARAVRPDAAPAKPATAPDVAQRKEFKQHVAAARKLGKAKRWGDAVTEWKAALAVLPGDARASS